MNGNPNSEGRMKYGQCWEGNKLSFSIRKRKCICIRTTTFVLHTLPSPSVHTFHERPLTLHIYFLLGAYSKMISLQKWGFFAPSPAFCDQLLLFFFTPPLDVKAQNVTTFSSKRQTIKYLLLLTWCFTKLYHKHL